MNTVEYTTAQPEIKGQGFTRRDALASIGALALAASSTAALASAAGIPSDLDKLIQRYIAAETEWAEAEEQCGALTKAYRDSLRTDPVVVECSGQTPWQITIADSNEVHANVVHGRAARAINDLVRLVSGPATDRDIERSLNMALAERAENMKRLSSGYEAVEQRAATMGLPAAEARENAAEAAMHAALDAVLAYRPRTLREVWQYCDFIKSDHGFGAHVLPSEKHMDLIFAALSSPEGGVHA
ncbi:hypothetical protein D3218_10715 [Aureimonas flava]|uniref:Uncharacterized protein n=1 Tax=Aureimonas flava TaxID=2320271 RepID=A0A3A1WRS7_9HYPH|nr:hypothetical protein [Aureimonas flava]RIY00868.1 hypothetical protein D3218_10715 [Aureimonas flava]